MSETLNEAHFRQCACRFPMKVVSGYAFGDPLPGNARYIGEADYGVAHADAITIYVRCERETGHEGKHLARSTKGWTGE